MKPEFYQSETTNKQTCKTWSNWSKILWKIGFVVSDLVVGFGDQPMSINHEFITILVI